MAERYTRRRKDVDNAPYPVSRADMRAEYGARSINASAPHAAGKAPVSNMPGTAGGLTPIADWNKFFDRPAPLGASPSLAGETTAWTDPMKAWGGTPTPTDPSQAFRVAGAPPIGGPATTPMPTTPTALQYYQEGIKGSQPFVPGAVRPGDSFKGSGTDFASVTSAPSLASLDPLGNPLKPDPVREFFKRYPARRA